MQNKWFPGQNICSIIDVNLVTKDVTDPMQLYQQMRALLQTAYQNNQVTSLIFHGTKYTGTVDFLTPKTVYLGLRAGRSCQLPLMQISQVHLHQSQPWWHLYD